MSFLKNIFGKKEEEKPIETYQDFWTWFLENEKQFFKVVDKGGNENIGENFFDKLEPKLSQLKEGIWYLTGMFNDTTADLILTSDGNIQNFYIIEELIAEAPNLPNWKFQAHKPSSNIENTAIDMAGFKFNKNNMFFYANDLEDYPDEIDITILHEDYSEENKNDIIRGSYIFLDNFLGELKTTTVIDHIDFRAKSDAEKELVPIEKLDAFLTWREKEFIEKYEGTRFKTKEDSYIGIEATLKNESPLVAVMNSDLLNWEATASHPWILTVKIPYNGENTNGMPETAIYELLNDIEEDISTELKDFEGYLNVGRETGDNIREIFFACKDYRKPCKVLDIVVKKYQDKIAINYEIGKDKYWRCFNWHRKSILKSL